MTGVEWAIISIIVIIAIAVYVLIATKPTSEEWPDDGFG